MLSHNHTTINAALPLDNVSIQHLVDFKPAEARRFADLAESHGVESWKLRAMLREVDKLIPPMNFGMLNGKPNANNGKPHHWYTIGKEYSRVVYLHVVKAYIHTPFDYDDLTRKLDRIASKYRADEHYVTENSTIGESGEYIFRFWWD